MKSYAYEIPSTQLDSAVRQSNVAEFPAGGCGDDADRGQQSLRLQTGNPYRRTLFRHLIATASLAVITVVFWLFLLGLPPSTYSRNAARSKPTDQQNTKHKGRQQI